MVDVVNGGGYVAFGQTDDVANHRDDIRPGERNIANTYVDAEFSVQFEASHTRQIVPAHIVVNAAQQVARAFQRGRVAGANLLVDVEESGVFVLRGVGFQRSGYVAAHVEQFQHFGLGGDDVVGLFLLNPLVRQRDNLTIDTLEVRDGEFTDHVFGFRLLDDNPCSEQLKDLGVGSGLERQLVHLNVRAEVGLLRLLDGFGRDEGTPLDDNLAGCGIGHANGGREALRGFPGDLGDAGEFRILHEVQGAKQRGDGELLGLANANGDDVGRFRFDVGPGAFTRDDRGVIKGPAGIVNIVPEVDPR